MKVGSKKLIHSKISKESNNVLKACTHTDYHALQISPFSSNKSLATEELATAECLEEKNCVNFFGEDYNEKSFVLGKA